MPVRPMSEPRLPSAPAHSRRTFTRWPPRAPSFSRGIARFSLMESWFGTRCTQTRSIASETFVGIKAFGPTTSTNCGLTEGCGKGLVALRGNPKFELSPSCELSASCDLNPKGELRPNYDRDAQRSHRVSSQIAIGSYFGLRSHFGFRLPAEHLSAVPQL